MEVNKTKVMISGETAWGYRIYWSHVAYVVEIYWYKLDTVYH